MTECKALLLTDVVDSTKLTEQLGDRAMAEAWAAHDRAARDLLPRWRGREIGKTDGMLLLFDSASAAVDYATDSHRALRGLPVPLQARAGLHVGPVVLRENRTDDIARGAKPREVEGIAVPIVARIMSVATGGQTLLSPAAQEALGKSPRRIRSHGHWRMKGVAEPAALFEVGDDASPWQPPFDGAKVYRVVPDGDLGKPLKEVRHNLPRERDKFVGRGSDLAALARLVDEGAALVTLVGTAGSGKKRRRLALDLDNLVAACRRAVARGDGEPAAAALSAAWAVFDLRGPFVSGIALGREALACGGLSAAARARVLCCLGRACRAAGRTEEAQEHDEGALAIHREVGDRRNEGIVLGDLGLLS